MADDATKKNRPKNPDGPCIVKMVRLVGVEPTTYRLGGDRSIQVSYNRNYMRCIIANPSLPRNPYQPHCALYFMASCLEIRWLP